MKKQYLLIFIFAGLLAIFNSCQKSAEYKALIVTGQNNHNWKASSPILKQLLEQTGLFTAEIVKTPEKKGDMSTFNPDFSKYNVVVIDYNGDSWSDKTKAAFVEYVNNGGGVVIYHGSNNAFPEWKEFNLMTGLGGWGNRSAKDGPYIYFKKDSMIIDTTAGRGGSHAKRHEFEVKMRNTGHPITKGLPARWRHGNDELYSQLRGPGKNMEILATAFADTAGGGTGRSEPMLMTITYGKGRIFHTVLGHADEGGGPAMECVGFIATFQRGAEWAASGKVTQKVPYDFPNAAGVSLRTGFIELSLEYDLSKISQYDITKSTKYFTDLQSRIRNEAKTPEEFQKFEKLMIKVLGNKDATDEGKKLLLGELSWMGSDLCIPVIKELAKKEQLKDAAEFALARLQPAK
ncbi:MAG: ThuA domain-containing protein [Bacteroidia bacterium]|nr:ThuA domain-containing protein [Bacteroidia bacterium]